MCESKLGINSHIQMPKFLLRRFHNKYNGFWYYDVPGGFISKNGTAKSTNTEIGYYSESVEHYLRDEIETPFSRILEYLDAVDFDKDTFSVESSIYEAILNFFYALMVRNPSMVDEMRGTGVYFQFLSKQEQHDCAVVNGMKIARKSELLSDYVLTFFINKTSVPFVLGVGGLYSYALNGHSAVNLPISPQFAIALIHKGYSSNLKRKGGSVAMLEVSSANITYSMNQFAFMAQVKQKWGRVVCPEQDELERLKKIYVAGNG